MPPGRNAGASAARRGSKQSTRNSVKIEEGRKNSKNSSPEPRKNSKLSSQSPPPQSSRRPSNSSRLSVSSALAPRPSFSPRASTNLPQDPAANEGQFSEKPNVGLIQKPSLTSRLSVQSILERGPKSGSRHGTSAGTNPGSRPGTQRVGISPRVEYVGTSPAQGSSLPVRAPTQVTAFFESHEPLGIMFNWSSPLPIVAGVLPNSFAQLRPQIVPGLTLTAINGWSISSRVTREEIEHCLNVRPLTLAFEQDVTQGALPARATGLGISAYHRGECYRALQPIIMREFEDIRSAAVAEAEAGTIFEVVDHGVGPSGRRLKVQAAGHVGWMSFMTQDGIVLLDTQMAVESEPSPPQTAISKNRPTSQRSLHTTARTNTAHTSSRSPTVSMLDSEFVHEHRRSFVRDQHKDDNDSDDGVKKTSTSQLFKDRLSMSIGAVHRSASTASAGGHHKHKHHPGMLDTIWRAVSMPMSDFDKKDEVEEESDDDDFDFELEAHRRASSRRLSLASARSKAMIHLDMEDTVDGAWHTNTEKGACTIKGNIVTWADGSRSQPPQVSRISDVKIMVVMAGEPNVGQLIGHELVWSNGDIWNKRLETWTEWFMTKSRLADIQLAIVTKRIQVEQDEPYFPAAHLIATDMRFEVLIGFLILINMFFLAVETFHDPDSLPVTLIIAEHLFTVIFLIEFFIRFMAFSWVWCFNALNAFDIFLIWFTGVLTLWILTPIGVDLTVLRRLSALRILRLARVCRAVRIMPQFRELWVLVQGVMGCGALLVWTLLLGAVVHYTFAVAFIELVAKDPTFENDSTVQHHLGDILNAMFTLFQIMTFDSWAGIVRPIVVKDPKSVVLFMIFVGFAGIVLFNLMTAIVVKNAFDASESDEEAQSRYANDRKNHMRAELLDMFKDLDEDNSGELSLSEFTQCMDDVAFLRKMQEMDIDLEDLGDIFEILDDGDGQVNQEEFCTGLMQMQGVATSCEVMKACCITRIECRNAAFLEDAFVVGSLDVFDRVEGHIHDVSSLANEFMVILSEVMSKLDHVGLRKVVAGTAQGLPTLMDPDLQQLVKKESSGKKSKHQTEEELAAEEALAAAPRESFMPTKVPPQWIIRNGKTPLAKNPGKLKLLQRPELMDKILSKKPASLAKKKTVITGARRDFGKTWEALELPLTEMTTLKGPEMDDDPLYEPLSFPATVLPIGCIGPGQRPNSSKKVDPLAALGLPFNKASTPKPSAAPVAGAPSLTPGAEAKAAAQPHHPHAVPQ